MAQQPLKEGILSQSDNLNEVQNLRNEQVTQLGKSQTGTDQRKTTCQ